MLANTNNEYQSKEEEIRDGWRGTLLGVLVIIILGLGIREFIFSSAYLGSAGLVGMGLKIGVAITFAVTLFFIKDAPDYSQLEKVRFVLFGLLIFCIFACWLVAFSNRCLPDTLESELVEVEVTSIRPKWRISEQSRQLVHIDADVILTDKVAMSTANNEADGSAIIRLTGEKADQIEPGSKITARLYHGRWGQDFIFAAE